MRKFMDKVFEVLDYMVNFIKDMTIRTAWRETDNFNIFINI